MNTYYTIKITIDVFGFSLLAILNGEGLVGDPSIKGLAIGPLDVDGQARPGLPHHLLLALAYLAGQGAILSTTATARCTDATRTRHNQDWDITRTRT